MKRILILTSLLILVVTTVRAQFAAQYSQYMYNPIALNPGATGKDNALNVTLNYRTMWQGLQGAPKTMYANLHTPLKNESISVGFQFYNDQIGVSRSNGVLFSGAYRIKMNKSGLAFGLGAGAMANQVNWQDVKTVEQGDRVFSQPNSNYWLPSASAGVFFHSQNAFAGLSIPQLFAEVYAGGESYKVSASPQLYTVQATGGHWFRLNTQNRILISSLLRYNHSSMLQPEMSLIYSYNHLFDVGISYRMNEAVVGIVKMKLTDQFDLSYSYDYMTGKLAAYNKGTHELCLLYTFRYRSNSPSTKLY